MTCWRRLYEWMQAGVWQSSQKQKSPRLRAKKRKYVLTQGQDRPQSQDFANRDVP